MRFNQRRIPAEKLTDELLKLVESDPQRTQSSALDVFRSDPRVEAVKMMLAWAVARSEANNRRPFGFGVNSSAEDRTVSQEVLDENRAIAGSVAADILRSFYETAGTLGETFLFAGKQAQIFLHEAISEGIPVAQVATLFRERLDQRERGQQVFRTSR